MANQLLEVTDLAFRVMRKTKAGTFDLVVFDGTVTQNIRVAGVIDVNTVGYAHIEFDVQSSACTVVTLNDTALNARNAIGYVCFEYTDRAKNKQVAFLAVTEFLQESSGGKYYFYVNGNTSAQVLPPLYN